MMGLLFSKCRLSMLCQLRNDLCLPVDLCLGVFVVVVAVVVVGCLSDLIARSPR